MGAGGLSTLGREAKGIDKEIGKEAREGLKWMTAPVLRPVAPAAIVPYQNGRVATPLSPDGVFTAVLSGGLASFSNWSGSGTGFSTLRVSRIASRCPANGWHGPRRQAFPAERARSIRINPSSHELLYLLRCQAQHRFHRSGRGGMEYILISACEPATIDLRCKVGEAPSGSGSVGRPRRLNRTRLPPARRRAKRRSAAKEGNTEGYWK